MKFIASHITTAKRKYAPGLKDEREPSPERKKKGYLKDAFDALSKGAANFGKELNWLFQHGYAANSYQLIWSSSWMRW